MCPDPQMLSVYLDGELPDPWNEKMEDHLAQCSECRQRLENYKRLQDLFKKNTRQYRTIVDRAGTESDPGTQEHENKLMEASKERVWRKLESRRRFRSYGLMRRRVSLPLPAAAAAAAVVVIAFAALWIRGGISQQPDYTARGNIILTEEELPGFIPAAADMNGVLQYLDSDGSDIIILRLPESKNFFRAGEPVITTADYKRSRP